MKSAFMFFGTVGWVLFWIYLAVVQLPLLLTGGGLGYFAGVAFVVLSVTVPAFMVWKILTAKTKTTSKE